MGWDLFAPTVCCSSCIPPQSPYSTLRPTAQLHPHLLLDTASPMPINTSHVLSYTEGKPWAVGVSSGNSVGGTINCCGQIVHQGGGRSRRFDPVQHLNSSSSHQGKLRYKHLTALTPSPSSGAEETINGPSVPKLRHHCCHLCLSAVHCLDLASCCGVWCRVWVTAHNFYGNLLWFLFSLRLLSINFSCICFLK